MKALAYATHVLNTLIPSLKHDAAQDVGVLDIPEFTPSCQKVQEFWDSQDKIKMLVGANQSGKTITSAAYVADFVRNHPGCLVWAVAVNFDMTKICFDPLMELFNPAEVLEPIWAARGKGIAYSIQHVNGGTVVFKSADAGFKKFEGAQVDLVWLDEQVRDKMVFSSCLARTTMTGGQVLLSFTPLIGKTHWSYTDLFQNPSVFSRTITLYDNHYLPAEERDAMIALYSPEEIPYRVNGEWGIMEGRVYKFFNATTHVIPRTQQLLDSLQVVIRGIDFGHHKACIWVGIDYNERAYLLAEWVGEDVTMQEMAEEIFALEREVGASLTQKIVDTVTDHAFQERFELERHGISCTPADKSIDLGLEIVRRRLKVHDGETRPNLYICDCCPDSIAEYENYVMDAKTGKPKKPQADHLCDGSRYALVEIDDYCEFRFGVTPAELIGAAVPGDFPSV